MRVRIVLRRPFQGKTTCGFLAPNPTLSLPSPEREGAEGKTTPGVCPSASFEPKSSAYFPVSFRSPSGSKPIDITLAGPLLRNLSDSKRAEVLRRVEELLKEIRP